ncbi:alpha/beta fold hydrolase [Mycobacteroides abscessus]|uniref:alpha/beta fold hydrolase n=1 Tax=Mycobacteroides abscessus TaxID=36809 RepID=UPI001F2A71BF|nr:alpha/beta hydrolase [Mycobacteroides abscessus]
MPNVEVNGQSIHYTDSGGDGRVILATHATLMDTVSLEPLTDRLDGYRVIAFDLRGHGRTVYDKQPYDYLDVADDALALADHLGIDTFTFLGEGQGAVVALRAALKAPARVERLILIGPTADAASVSENAALDASMDVWCTYGPDPEVYHLVALRQSKGSQSGVGVVAKPLGTVWNVRDVSRCRTPDMKDAPAVQAGASVTKPSPVGTEEGISHAKGTPNHTPVQRSRRSYRVAGMYFRRSECWVGGRR